MKEISVQELKQKIDNKEDFQLIDVRETFEYETSNLDGLNIPLGGILIETDKIGSIYFLLLGIFIRLQVKLKEQNVTAL